MSAVQTGLRGPITASEQTDDFRTTPDGYWLLARSDVRQTYEGAAVRTPIHRLLVVDRHEIDPADFDRRRAGAYASTDVMLRDTPKGFRYLKRPRSDRGPEAPAAAAATEPVPGGPCGRASHAGVRRHRRPEHLAASAVCRAQLRRSQPVQPRRAAERLLRRNIRSACAVGAVARGHALAARRARVRNRLLVQRPGLRTGPRALRAGHRTAARAGHGLAPAPLDAACLGPFRLRMGLHPLRRRRSDRATIRGSRESGRSRGHARGGSAARGMAGVSLVESRVADRLASMGGARHRGLPVAEDRLSAIRRQRLALRRSAPRPDDARGSGRHGRRNLDRFSRYTFGTSTTGCTAIRPR